MFLLICPKNWVCLRLQTRKINSFTRFLWGQTVEPPFKFCHCLDVGLWMYYLAYWNHLYRNTPLMSPKVVIMTFLAGGSWPFWLCLDFLSLWWFKNMLLHWLIFHLRLKITCQVVSPVMILDKMNLPQQWNTLTIQNKVFTFDMCGHLWDFIWKSKRFDNFNHTSPADWKLKTNYWLIIQLSLWIMTSIWFTTRGLVVVAACPEQDR